MVNETSRVALITPTDPHNTFCNLCAIEYFDSIFVTLLFWIVCWYIGLCHTFITLSSVLLPRRICALLVNSSWNLAWVYVTKLSIFCVELIETVILWVYYTIPHGFSLFRHFWEITFQLLKLLCLAQDHWRGYCTRNAHMVHIVN